jgi:hypothetical protein
MKYVALRKWRGHHPLGHIAASAAAFASSWRSGGSCDVVTFAKASQADEKSSKSKPNSLVSIWAAMPAYERKRRGSDKAPGSTPGKGGVGAKRPAVSWNRTISHCSVLPKPLRQVNGRANYGRLIPYAARWRGAKVLSLTCAVDGFAVPACVHNPSSLRREHGFFSDPPRYRVPVKSPIGAYSEARNLTALGQLVKRARVNTEQVTKFLYRQYFVIAWHV